MRRFQCRRSFFWHKNTYKLKVLALLALLLTGTDETQEGHKDLSICLSLWWPYNGVLLDSMMQGTSLDSPSWCKVELPISGVSLLITRPPQPSQKEASFTSSFCSNAIYLQFLSALFSGLYTFLLRRTHLFCELRNPGARRWRILLCYKDAKEEEPFDGQPKEEEIR